MCWEGCATHRLDHLLPHADSLSCQCSAGFLSDPPMDFNIFQLSSIFRAPTTSGVPFKRDSHGIRTAPRPVEGSVLRQLPVHAAKVFPAVREVRLHLHPVGQQDLRNGFKVGFGSNLVLICNPYNKTNQKHHLAYGLIC